MSTAMLAAFQASVVTPAIFVQATFKTGPIYVWTGFGSIVWNGQTWSGLGSLGAISAIEEGTNVEAKGLTISLSGVDPTMLVDVLLEFQLAAPVIIYIGAFNTSVTPPVLFATPLCAWAGRMDVPTIDVGGTVATISIACENRLLDMNTSVYRRYTNDDQVLDYPGDLGMQFVAGIQEMTIYWGQNPTNTNNR